RRSRGDPGRPVRARGRRGRRRRVPPRGTPFGARAGGVRRAGGGGPTLAHEPRRDAVDRARRRGGLERRRPAPAALAVARVASRSGGPRQGGRGREAASAGGARCGGADHRAGEKTGWGRLRRLVEVGGGCDVYGATSSNLLQPPQTLLSDDDSPQRN